MLPLQRPSVLAQRQRRWPAIGLILLLAAPLARAQGQPTPLQRLRAMLGIIRPVTVGGSRSERDQLCVLSPWLQPELKSSLPMAVAVALTPSGAPPIATAVPLAELQILRSGSLLWRGRASSTGPMANPLAWPLPPLQPGESVLLRLRKQQAAGGDFSTVELRRPQAGASSTSVAAGADPSQAFLTLVQQGRKAAAIEGLFEGDLNGHPQLRQWAQEMIASGCSGGTPR